MMNDAARKIECSTKKPIGNEQIGIEKFSRPASAISNALSKTGQKVGEKC